mmetsp:Transcript_21873/g.66390  ORF Transcript_21873/g.66390 Transcript_21873/m.66390 type:complete len:220 (+) Transcript_21873:75-734(+)|eukprot:scaffold167776_cov44-Tisochrysis_lutea.AAC.1
MPPSDRSARSPARRPAAHANGRPALSPARARPRPPKAPPSDARKSLGSELDAAASVVDAGDEEPLSTDDSTHMDETTQVDEVVSEGEPPLDVPQAPQMVEAAVPPGVHAVETAKEPTGTAASRLILFAALMMLFAYALQPYALKSPDVGVVEASKILKRSKLADITKTPSMPMPSPSLLPPSSHSWSSLFAAPPPSQKAPDSRITKIVKPFQRLVRKNK